MNAETLVPDSTYVDVPSLPWKPTRFPGVEAKTLMENPATGMSTVLMRWAPGRAFRITNMSPSSRPSSSRARSPITWASAVPATTSGAAPAAGTMPGPTKAA